MSIAEVGTSVGSVDVKIGPQFLNLFSEHLYSSPNKAFEELVSNSWDAGAKRVYINVPDNLTASDAAIWVLDDGTSMDLDGFRGLWSVATSNKRAVPPAGGRRPIGKFGVGKLATYLLADELTYVCCAADGQVRTVTMDYRRIDKHDKGALHIAPLPLEVRQLQQADLDTLISALPNGAELLKLIKDGVPGPEKDADFVDEFGGPADVASATAKTWTLAILSSLKGQGQKLQVGWVRRLLRTSLPLGNTISIFFNEELLSPAKASTELVKEWQLGPGIDLGPLSLDTGEEINAEEKSTPYPHLVIPEIGEVTGSVKLYESNVAGGKSEKIDVSNGFFINIRGRVLKPEDPYFGLENLSHSVWPKFRATIRVDSLDEKLAVNREAVADSRELAIVKLLLMKLFNKARSEYSTRTASSWPQVGDVLAEKWGAVPFQPLERLVKQGFDSRLQMNDFIDMPPAAERTAVAEEWEKQTSENPGELITDVTVSDLGVDAKLVRYDVATRRVIVNRNHPFAEEHGETSEQLRVLRDAALVDLLTDAFMADIGVPPDQLGEIREYRDRAFRLVAQVRRRSAVQIAAMLVNSTNHAKGFERIIGDALDHLGFSVERMGQSGQPEGVATAVVPPTSDDRRVSYKFTYDAKSSGKGKSKTHNVGIAGLARHRKDHEADHTLVVSPGFEAGALVTECEANQVTPMLAADLARLLAIAMGYGPINLVEFRDVFKLYDPTAVTAWVSELEKNYQNAKQLSLDLIVKALTALTKKNPDRPDMLHCSQIADECRAVLGDTKFPNRSDVATAIRGLALMAPNVISIGPNMDVFLNASPAKIREAIIKQLNAIPDKMRFGLARGTVS